MTWTTCTNGDCLEFNADNGHVYLRNSRSPQLVVEATQAEWDTYVEGLTAAVRAERDEARAELAVVGEMLDEVQTKVTGELIPGVTTLRTERDNLAAENARLRQRVEGLLHELAGARGQRDEANVTRDSWRVAYRQVADDLGAKLELAGAELDTLRPIVEAASAWRETFVVTQTYGPGAPGLRTRALIAAVDNHHKIPSARLSEPLSQDPPPVVTQPADGPGTQREAQRAGDDTCPGCSSTDRNIRYDVWSRAADDDVPCGHSWHDVAVTENEHPTPTNPAGLDEAWDAAYTAYWANEDQTVDTALDAAIRAAAPHTTRAALQAAADDLEQLAKAMDLGDSRPDGVELAVVILRERANQTSS